MNLETKGRFISIWVALLTLLLASAFAVAGLHDCPAGHVGPKNRVRANFKPGPFSQLADASQLLEPHRACGALGYDIAAGSLVAPKKLAGMSAAERRAHFFEKGVPAHEIGPSGYPKIHTAKHSTLKRAKDAARERAGKGGTTVKHPSPTEGEAHFHGVTPEGEKIRIHDEYPR